MLCTNRQDDCTALVFHCYNLEYGISQARSCSCIRCLCGCWDFSSMLFIQLGESSMFFPGQRQIMHKERSHESQPSLVSWQLFSLHFFTPKNILIYVNIRTLSTFVFPLDVDINNPDFISYKINWDQNWDWKSAKIPHGWWDNISALWR